jgi:large subunit ribosomal protein L30
MPKSSGTAGKRGSKKAAADTARLSIKQVKSGIGHAATYRRTLEALGLRHHQQTIVVNDTPSIRGMLFKVRHLIQVTPAEKN